MPRKLSSLLEEADGVISSRMNSHAKQASAPTTDDSILAMADWVRASGDAVKVAAEEPAEDDALFTVVEKVAHAKALLETYANLPTLLKISELEKAAAARGFSDAQIEAYLEKNAAEFALKSVL